MFKLGKTRANYTFDQLSSAYNENDQGALNSVCNGDHTSVNMHASSALSALQCELGKRVHSKTPKLLKAQTQRADMHVTE